jgi:GNAT superfamily N-acetyltransferase
MGAARELDVAETEAAARSLGDAFADDPVMGWMGGFTDDAARITHLARAAIEGRFRKPAPLMFTTEGNDAIALWNAPGDAELSALELVRAAPAIVRCFRTGVIRTMSVLHVMDAAHPTEEHYYLFMVGVRRSRQGSGLGSAVLAPMLERCDAEGMPAYLENSNPRNEPFYARHGFVARDPLPLPDGAPPMTPMWREPR